MILHLIYLHIAGQQYVEDIRTHKSEAPFWLHSNLILRKKIYKELNDIPSYNLLEK